MLVARREDPDPAPLLSAIRARNRGLLDFKRVGGVVLWHEDFPRTASMKVKRPVLADEIRARFAAPDDAVVNVG